MSPLLTSLVAFAIICAGAFLGMFMRNRLPGQHLSGDTKDVVRLGTGLIVFWLTIIFMSFSLFADINAVAITALFIFALSASASLFLILELSQPFTGLMMIPSDALRNALAPMVS